MMSPRAGSKLVFGLALSVGCVALVCVLAYSFQPSQDEDTIALEARLRRKTTSIQGQHAAMKVIWPAAKLLANSMLFTAVAQHARSNPHKPGRAAMNAVLQDPNSRKQIQAAVINKLSNVHSGEDAVQIEQEVPEQYRSLIPSVAKLAATQATSMAFVDLRVNLLKAEGFPEDQDKGYLEAGSSLPNMPIKFGANGEFGPVDLATIRFKCKSACEQDDACKAFTFLPSTGVCYLKSKITGVRGTECTEKCWYFGAIPARNQ